MGDQKIIQYIKTTFFYKKCSVKISGKNTKKSYLLCKIQGFLSELDAKMLVVSDRPTQKNFITSVAI